MFRLVEIGDGGATGFVVHFHESKTSGAAGVSIRNDLRRIYAAEWRKEFFEILVCNGPGKIANKKLHKYTRTIQKKRPCRKELTTELNSRPNRIRGQITLFFWHIQQVGEPMLELKPSCENCNNSLPYNCAEAMICTFECTFCAECVSAVLHNVCPNCGGGFQPRPIRPSQDWVAGAFLGRFPATSNRVHKPVDQEQQRLLVERQSGLPPERR